MYHRGMHAAYAAVLLLLLNRSWRIWYFSHEAFSLLFAVINVNLAANPRSIVNLVNRV